MVTVQFNKINGKIYLQAFLLRWW